MYSTFSLPTHKSNLEFQIDITRKGVALNESCYPYKQIDCFWSVSPFLQKKLQHLCCKELPTDAAEDHPLCNAKLFKALPHYLTLDILRYILDFKIHFFWLLLPKFTSLFTKYEAIRHSQLPNICCIPSWCHCIIVQE